ncbi:hypothetical protein AAC387_Pa01g4383 [Persea americana]
MAISENTDLSPTQNPSSSPPPDEEIQLPNPQSENADAEPEEKAAASDGEIRPSTDAGDSQENKKRKTPEEEGGGKEEEKGSLHPLWKTSLCSYFRRQSGSCSHGDTCRYAHGEEELRPRLDNSWDPTSERAKKLLKSDGGERIEAPTEPREDILSSLPGCEGDDHVDAELDKCLVHLPRKWASDNLKSFLNTEGIIYKTAKKKKGMTVGFVSFESTEHVKNAIEALDGKCIGNKQLKVANVIPRSCEKKLQVSVTSNQSSTQPTEGLTSADPAISASSDVVENDDNMNKDSKVADDSVSKARSARDVVTPLAHMPYSDQLEHKKSSLVQILKRLTRNARKACPDAVPLPEWTVKSREIGGLPCKLEGIIESPLINGYRNKCEFSVGYSLQGKRTVGFMLGNFREGMTAVEESVDCPNVSRIACKYAMIFQEFLQSSALPLWNRFDNTGFWRQFTVREGRNPCQDTEVESAEACVAEVMLIVQICSVGAENELVTREFQRMAQALAYGASTSSPPLPLTALVIQDHKGISNAAPADSPLIPLSITKEENMFGLKDPTAPEARIHDYIGGLRFCISPTAFFQVNTLAAEKLYSLAGDWAGLGRDTLLFDICCGTGTIGLTLANRVGMVVGIEMNDSAVLDAKRNAEINGIRNCRFVCSKAEDVMGSLLREYLNAPQKQDETSRVSRNSNENIIDGENGSHNDKMAGIDAYTPNAVVSNGCVERVSKCSDEKIGEDFEVTRESKEGVLPIDHIKETTDCYFVPNESLDHQMDDIKSSPSVNQENAIPEANGTSAMPIQQFKDVVAIVDPPRVGLHPVVIKALRTHPRLRRLVYISCNPESLVANAIELCTPSPDKPDKGKNNRGWRNMSSAGLARHRAKSMPNSEPFRPVKAMAVDLFPHTPHCEMVMLLER